MYSCGPPHMAVQKQDNQNENTFSNYVRIRDVVQKTCLRRWTIEKSGDRGSGISVLPARHDDDEDGLKRTSQSFTGDCYYLIRLSVLDHSNRIIRDETFSSDQTRPSKHDWPYYFFLFLVSCLWNTGWNDKIVALEKTTWFHFHLMKTGFLYLLQTIY